MLTWTEKAAAEVADFHGLSSQGRVQVWLGQLELDRQRSIELRDAPLPRGHDLPALVADSAAPPDAPQDSGDSAPPETGDDRSSAVDAVEEALDRAAAHSDLNAFTALLPDRARRDAATTDRRQKAGENLALAGKTFAVKDVIAVAGHTMTAGTPAFHRPESRSDAPAVASLVEQGATVIGMANLQALAFGASGTGSLKGAVVNPAAKDRLVGGSSGGSAAAVAAGVVDFALGTDTGGSIRIPSSLCGVVGLKPTFGTISNAGLHPVSPTLDHVGPLGRSVQEVERVFAALAGRSVPTLHRSSISLQGVTIGSPRSWFEPLLDEQIFAAWKSFLSAVQHLGGHIVDVEMPSLSYAPLAQWAIIAPDAFESNIELLRTDADRLPDDVRLRLEMGMFRLSTDYVRAQHIRRWISQEKSSALATCDVLAWPTIPIAAPAVGETFATLGNATVDVASALTSLTTPYNLTGFPALTIPWGRDSTGAGIGMQIGAKPRQETAMFSVAGVLEDSFKRSYAA
jgi:aspartyl-tRNA(Asn)/glutamyl-tRNA(Gln) amidotransferase subunit A